MGGNSHPFLDPLWRRVVVVLVCGGWAALEAFHGDTFWSVITLGITVYAVWSLLISYTPSSVRPDQEKSGE